MRRRKHLHVQAAGRFEDEPPHIVLHRVVQAALYLVYQQQAVFRVDEGQRNAKHTVDALAQTLERNTISTSFYPYGWYTF